MAQVIVSETPQGARDEIVAWLHWHAKRFQRSGTMDTREGEKALAIGDQIELLANELGQIPCMNFGYSIEAEPKAT